MLPGHGARAPRRHPRMSSFDDGAGGRTSVSSDAMSRGGFDSGHPGGARPAVLRLRTGSHTPVDGRPQMQLPAPVGPRQPHGRRRPGRPVAR
jgi:hypothetical protein